ncbi:MAG: protein translocase subunit SecF [Thermoflexales bacterium]|nr:protein translocase subunit SecF [Thermoflexales bacterium]
MFNIVEKRKWYYLLSLAVILPGVLAMIYSTATLGSPLRLSIDFTGGSLFVLQFEGPAGEEAIRAALTEHGEGNAVIQRLGAPGDNSWQVRAGFMDAAKVDQLKTALNTVARLDTNRSTFDNVAPSIGGEVTRAATIAVFAAALVILVFIWYAFRKVPNAIRYATCAIIAMVHDILVTMGLMSLAGLVLGWEVDALFLTAMLTVIGFSVQDTIVVYDRIRENIPKRKGEPFETVVNRSLLETLHRSLATQLNAIFIMFSILLFGGATIKQFIAIILVGLLSGTYSSIFNATPLVVSWELGEFASLFGLRKQPQGA